MLHLTKVAFGAASIEQLLGWWADRGESARLNTRYRPKRADELIGGSLYWILKHQLVARSEILSFEEGEAGRTDIVVSSRIVRVQPLGRRAHQGWRYLEPADAPPDLSLSAEGNALPHALMSDLAALGLL